VLVSIQSCSFAIPVIMVKIFCISGRIYVSGEVGSAK
jgi:hypothetical protein